MKTLLLVLVSFIAITATISGLLMIAGPDGAVFNLPTSILRDTPFNNFLVPGIILTTLVGGVNLVAVITNLLSGPTRYNWAMAGGAMICGWIIVQLILLQAALWLHFLYLGTGLLIILIGYQLKGKWAV